MLTLSVAGFKHQAQYLNRWFAAEPGLKEPTSIIACRPYQARS